MRTFVSSDRKSCHLRENGTLNPHPEKVRDALFQSHPFFDPRDLVQVKYEMLRQVQIEGQSVRTATQSFGFSRVRWYKLCKALAAEGLLGLLPQRKGPRQASKVSEEVVTFIQQLLCAEPELRLSEVPGRVAQRFGVSIHLRSVQRALGRSRKKAGCLVQQWRLSPRQSNGLGRSGWSGTKPCAVRRSKRKALSVRPVPWSWHSLNGRDWPRG